MATQSERMKLLEEQQPLLSEEAYERAHEIAKDVTYYDLITYPYYYDEFVSAKFLPHTDLEEFPTVAKKLAKGASP